MSQKKKNFVFIILFFIAVLSLGFILLDWLPLISKYKLQISYKYSYSFKVIVVLLTTLLVFISGNDCLSKRDLKEMKRIFILVLLADSALVGFQTPVIGILFFSFVQLCLVFRNSKGMREVIKSDGNFKLRRSLFINTILVTTLFILNLVRIMDNHMENKLLLLIMVLYGFMVSLSLWTAMANYLLKLFPKTNSIMVALGMCFFALCDINVGLSLILPEGLIRTISSDLVWIFYAPALTLLALSGYKYKNTENQSNSSFL
ncbi:hypothetical protein E9840_01695 [Tissierella creatinini]|nr:hypothetical protein E9840_01695 [Tissierella creatinini]TJX66483.1 hypothetical protein E8P77_07490 [Soehngenia saccharolytica]